MLPATSHLGTYTRRGASYHQDQPRWQALDNGQDLCQVRLNRSASSGEERSPPVADLQPACLLLPAGVPTSTAALHTYRATAVLHEGSCNEPLRCSIRLG